MRDLQYQKGLCGNLAIANHRGWQQTDRRWHFAFGVSQFVGDCSCAMRLSFMVLFSAETTESIADYEFGSMQR